MPHKDDRKRELTNEWKRDERARLIASIPIPHRDLKELFDFLDRENPPACDHTLRETIGFLTSRGLNPAVVIPWLEQHGGYCDCEVIYNVEEKFGEIVGREPEE
jgi:hypothetical protein